MGAEGSGSPTPLPHGFAFCGDGVNLVEGVLLAAGFEVRESTLDVSAELVLKEGLVELFEFAQFQHHFQFGGSVGHLIDSVLALVS